ncbi:protein EARLY FLOWERING 3 [Argentina anserina]|uniref:protein EARLY FLOWERING 3 n=1 Tax=Argentina anserina TaxID=57926 RepID=UPI002176878F|nr:protein EARLY FLOWERING 3 [Potentilla anserina]
MKRGGRDDDKVMGPMFPRLHVNDADKGGPRAPPRNKMALYEQLSIPSQRFNNGVMPLNQNSNSSMGSPSRSNQGNGSERNLPFPIHVRPSTPTRHSGQSDGVTVNVSSGQPHPRKRGGDEDDFMVPVFQSRMGQCQSGTQNGGAKVKLTPLSQSHSDRAIMSRSASKKDQKQSSSPSLNLRREFRSETAEDLNDCSPAKDRSVRASTSISTRERVNVPTNVNASPNQEYEGHPVPTFNRSCNNDACLQQDSRSGSQVNNTGQGDGLLDSTRDVEKGTVSQARSVSHYGENPSSPTEPDNDSEYHGDNTCSPPTGNADKGDDVSETSMVDSISGMDISPDDVVGIIGQKHFWKARKAIVNQQRLFAVQVFELHRLIKVQRLIAGSPHLLLEDSAFLGTSLRVSPAKKLPADYVVKPRMLKRKHESEKPNNKMECSAENAVGKSPHSSVKNGNQPSHYGPHVGNPPCPAPVPAPADNKAAPWCFHQPPGQQYLIPVMSPSEGLVYKPYNVPGFVGAACGSCGPFGSSPITGNFIKPAYGVPGSHHQGMGVLPVPHPTYFPPYGMSVMNPTMSSSSVEQMNWFAGPGLHGSTDQLSGNSNLQHQSSCNKPKPNYAAIPHTMKSRASNHSELQGSTGNSPGDRATITDQTAGESDALQLFPTVPAVPERVPQPHDTNQATRVIRVVPHNPRSATASAARIFQSIQEERKQ